jgi:hypothetical protein
MTRLFEQTNDDLRVVVTTGLGPRGSWSRLVWDYGQLTLLQFPIFGVPPSRLQAARGALTQLPKAQQAFQPGGEQFAWAHCLPLRGDPPIWLQALAVRLRH